MRQWNFDMVVRDCGHACDEEKNVTTHHEGFSAVHHNKVTPLPPSPLPLRLDLFEILLSCNCWIGHGHTIHVGLGTDNCLARFSEYQIIGRHLPSEANQNPKIYRMRVFAPNEVVAKSRFWYFLGKLRKIKKANGEIVSVNEVCTILRSDAASLRLERRKY
jgi:hypothetical protein